MKDVSAAEFRQGVQQFRDMIGTLLDQRRADVVTMCGGPEVLEALFEERGVGIGRFAALLGLVAQGSTMFSVQRQSPDPTLLPALKADVLARLGSAIQSLEERYMALGAQLERARALERLVQDNRFGQPEGDHLPA